MNSLEKFIQEIKKVWGPITTETVTASRALLSELAKAQITESWLAELLQDSFEGKELYRDPEHGFLLLAHTEKKGLYRVPHDHGSGWVVYAVQCGEMEMQTYNPIINQKGKMNLVRKDSYRMSAGDCKVYLPEDVHDTRCISDSVLMLRLSSCDLKKEDREGRMRRYVD